MKKLSYLFVLLLIFACGGDDGGGGDGGGDPPPPSPPGSVTLTSPANGKVCETGTSTSDTKSNVDFSWAASAKQPRSRQRGNRPKIVAAPPPWACHICGCAQR